MIEDGGRRVALVESELKGMLCFGASAAVLLALQKAGLLCLAVHLLVQMKVQLTSLRASRLGHYQKSNEACSL